MLKLPPIETVARIIHETNVESELQNSVHITEQVYAAIAIAVRQKEEWLESHRITKRREKDVLDSLTKTQKQRGQAKV